MGVLLFDYMVNINYKKKLRSAGLTTQDWKATCNLSRILLRLLRL